MTNLLFGALTVLVTTNFVGVSFTPIPCPHPGCAEGHHSFTATERYMIVRDTWAEVVNAAGQGIGKSRRLYSDTNDWGSLSHPIAHPAVYFMHTQPGWAVRPGTRWPLDMPPLPPWGTVELMPRRSSTTNLPTDIAGGTLMLKGGRHELPDTYRGTAIRDTSLYGPTRRFTTSASTNVLSRPAFTFSSNYTSAVNPNEIEITIQSKDGTRWKPVWTKEEPTDTSTELVRVSQRAKSDTNWIAAGTANFIFFSPDDSGTGFYKNSSNVLSFAYKGQHVFSSTNAEAMGWLMLKRLPSQGTSPAAPGEPSYPPQLEMDASSPTWTQPREIINSKQRFLSVPATNELRNSRRFKQ